MSIKLVKQPRRKTYNIRIWLEKYKKIKWINTYQRTEREAKKVLRKYQESEIEYKLGLREEQLPTEPIPTLSEGVDLYLEQVENNPDMSPNTYKLKKSVLNTFVDQMTGNPTIDKLGVEDSDDYDHYLKTTRRKSGAFKGATGLSEASINIRKRIATTFLNWCINDRKWIKGTEFKLEQSHPEPEIKLFTPEQFELILSKEPNELLRSYYKLAWFCGLRRVECNDTELYKDKNKVDCLLVATTKGRKQRKRDVPIPKKNISDWMNVKLAQYKLDYISKMFKKAVVNADLYVPYKTTFHTLRHSYATLQCVNGTHLLELAKLMGHADTKTTEKYANASREMLVKLQQEKGQYAIS